MSTWGSHRPMSVTQVREAWESVRDQVLKADLMLVVALDTPPEREAEAIPSGPVADCGSSCIPEEAAPNCC